MADTPAKPRLLIVDDARVNIDILLANLKADYQLNIALEGRTALQIAARTPLDLVLLDIAMPGMNGYEVCRELRKLPATAKVPIIFLSTLGDGSSREHCFKVGGNEFLPKPFDMAQVKSTIHALLASRPAGEAQES